MADDGTTAVNGQQPTALDEHSKTAPEELYPTRAFEELITYLSKEPDFCRLRELQLKGEQSQDADNFFKKQRHNADTANKKPRVQKCFFRMMRKIADWLNRATGAFQLAVNREAMVLDLCMAPGAFVDCALRSNPSAKVNALTLPEDQGGYRVLLDDWTESNRLEIQFKDVTMFAAEFGIPSVPDTHPDWEALRQEWPYQVEQYDLVICDGQVLRNQPKGVYGPRLEPARIISSQLYLGLKRILIHMFDQFSDIKLVKPAKNHAYRSSFYLVAMKIQTYHEAFDRMISLCSTMWMRSTFEYDNEGILESVSDWAFPEQSPGKQSEIEEYGARFIDLARPIWKIQATGLFHSRFM